MYLGLLDEGRRLPAAYWLESAPGTRRVEVELGPGTCRFVFESARRDDNTVFVGLEIQDRMVRRALASPGLPDNACVRQADAGWVVEHLLAEDSIDAFHLYFPDPWWKKKHHKRRLVTPAVAVALARTLRPGGAVYLVTDVTPLFAEIAERLGSAGLVEAAWQRDPDCPGQSSYERKYRAQGRKLYERRFEKVEPLRATASHGDQAQAMAFAGD